MRQFTTIIFDMGNVIIDFSPDYFLTKFTQDQEAYNVLKHNIFYHPLWSKADRGTISDEAFFEVIKQNVDAKYHELAYQVLHHWYDYKVERYDMLEIIKELSSAGYRLILCSNAATSFYKYKDKIEAFNYFDGFVISADLKIVKPEPGIYEYLLERFKLQPRECFFIDDLLANVKGAWDVGIDGYWAM